MAHFVFKLEGVLEQRQAVERQRQRDVAEAQRDVMRLERDLHDATVAAAEGSIELRGPIDARLLLAQARFEAAMRSKVQALNEHLDAARRILENTRAAMTEAAKQRKVIEKLRENQEAAWAAQQRRREAHAGDEVAQRIASNSGEIEATGT